MMIYNMQTISKNCVRLILNNNNLSEYDDEDILNSKIQHEFQKEFPQFKNFIDAILSIQGLNKIIFNN